MKRIWKQISRLSFILLGTVLLITPLDDVVFQLTSEISLSRRVRVPHWVAFRDLVTKSAEELGIYEWGNWKEIIDEAIRLLPLPPEQRREPEYSQTKQILEHYVDPMTYTGPDYDLRAMIELFWMTNIMVNGVGSVEERLSRITAPEIAGQRVEQEGIIFSRVLDVFRKTIDEVKLPDNPKPGWWDQAWKEGQLSKLLRLYGGTDSALIEKVNYVKGHMGLSTDDEIVELLKGVLRKDGKTFRSKEELKGIIEEWIKERPHPEVMFAGAGGGVVNVTMPALMDKYEYIAGLTGTTDDGGSTGDLKRFLYKLWGYLWGYGDTANVLEKSLLRALNLKMTESPQTRILAFRPSEKDSRGTLSFSTVLLRKIKSVMNEQAQIPSNNKKEYPGIYANPEYQDAMKVPGFLPFIVDLLNVADIIDEILEDEKTQREAGAMTYVGQSVRNLMGVAVYRQLGAFQGDHIDPESGRLGMYLLEYLHRAQDTGKLQPVHPLVATYDEAVLYVTIKGKVSPVEIKRIDIERGLYPDEEGAFVYDEKTDTTTIYGQKYIDVLRHSPEQKVIDTGLAIKREGKWIKDTAIQDIERLFGRETLVRVNDEYEEAIKNEELKAFVMGAGSLFSSLSCILAVPGIADALINRILDEREKGNEFKSVFIFNHVAQEETNGLSFGDIVTLIENLLNKPGMISKNTRERLGLKEGDKIKFGAVFNYVILNDTKAETISEYLTQNKLNKYGDAQGTEYAPLAQWSEQSADEELKQYLGYTVGIEAIKEAPEELVSNIKGFNEREEGKIYLVQTTAGDFLGLIDKEKKLHAIYIDDEGNYVGKARVDKYVEHYAPDGTPTGGGISPEGSPRFLFFPNRKADIYQGMELKEIYIDSPPEGLPIYLLNSFTYLLTLSKHSKTLQERTGLINPDDFKRHLLFLASMEQPPWIYAGRSEKGRPFSPIFATEKDEKYLKGQGVEVIKEELLSLQTKDLKAIGPKLLTETFIGMDREILKKILGRIGI